MGIKEELEQQQAAIAEHVSTLEAYAKYVQARGAAVHLVPVPDGNGGVVIRVVDTTAPDGKAPKNIEGVPAAFFYEAYRELTEEILIDAIEKARASAHKAACDLRQNIAARRAALDEAEEAISRFLAPAKAAPAKAAPAPAPATASPMAARAKRARQGT